MNQREQLPAISVVVPTYNAGRYVEEAVASVLAQDFRDFELLLIDDGSTDNTAEVVSRFAADPRVRLLRNERNLGLIATLHRAYAECRAPLIARMDSDDICAPDRFGRQVTFLHEHPEVGIVGGAIRFFGNVAPNVFTFPLAHADIHPAMLFYCPLAHPALMFRRELLDQGIIRYDDAFRHAEDYHLWSRLLLQVNAANLPEVVLDYRLHAQQVSSDSSDKQYAASLRVRRQMMQECGVEPTDEEIALHESVILERPVARTDYLPALAAWFARLEAAARQSGYWNEQALHRLLKGKFIDTARRVGADLSALANAAPTAGYVSTKDLTMVSHEAGKASLATRVKRRLKSMVWQWRARRSKS
ncbi:glycosyltransferase [Herbaspirillum sp. C7C2]|uniref:glycosyltransferase family 2 protein n=1 Tax=Herbaspirillum sp. C7C2 TaxID=2736666 RepID=UPI001F517513|nr:glycosyltransferase [Herbaspirillum sp. C7C2]MCI1014372.1 glycosyltransferase [Herbaspirillum sp. C7C2]